MAIPRNTISLTDINPKRQIPAWADNDTIVYSDAVARGHAAAGWGALTLVGDQVYALAADGEQVHGILLLVESDGALTIRTDGTGNFKAGTGATFTLGRGVVGAERSSAPGYVKGVTVATQAEEDIEFGYVYNDGDAEAIVIEF